MFTDYCLHNNREMVAQLDKCNNTPKYTSERGFISSLLPRSPLKSFATERVIFYWV